MNIKKMIESTKKYFEKKADEIALDTGFVQRKSKMSGSIFLKTFVFGFLANSYSSLNDLVEFCKEQFGVEISTQGLDGRINSFCQIFMLDMLRLALISFFNKIQLPIEILKQFTAVNLTDSTTVSLPEKQYREFPGSGGAASKSALKIQLVFDFLTGAFKKIKVTDGITPDQKYDGHIEVAEANSLNIFDLGYFSLLYLEALIQKGAYFLCRLYPSANLYDKEGNKIDLLTLLMSEVRDRFELSFLVGNKTQLPYRVLFFRVPEYVAQKRRRNAKKKGARQGRTVSKKTLELMGWTILLTNAPATMIPIEQAGLLYSVRWQIELLFKVWKSYMKLGHISGYRKERIIVELYAKLIVLVLFQFLATPLWEQDINLSHVKSFKRFARKAVNLARAFRSRRALKKAFVEIHSAILKFAKREKRKKRLTTLNQLILGINCYA
jgi:hypothetical protein